MKITKTAKTAILAAAISVVAAPAFADTKTYFFDLPAASSYTSGYPTVAELTLTDISGGVQFVLTPHWNDLPTGFDTQSIVKHLEYVYQGPALTSSSFTFLSGAPIDSFSYQTNPNMDSGYKSDAQYISVDWLDKNDADRFDKDFASSSWTVTGTGVDLADFTGTQAWTTSGKPEPIFGIISVAPYSLTDPNPTPSNWVSAVPEPETYAMFLAGLGLMGFMARRRSKTS